MRRLVPLAAVAVLAGCGGSHTRRECPRETTLLDAGHGVVDPTPNVPESLPELEGRDRQANARARVDAWPKLLRFLSG